MIRDKSSKTVIPATAIRNDGRTFSRVGICRAQIKMKKSNFFLVIGLVTVLGIRGFLLLGNAEQPGSQETFKLIRTGSAKTDTGTDLSFRTYLGSQGTPVYVEYATLRSTDKARTEFAHRLTEAVKILAQGPKKDGSGRQTGKRAIVLDKDSNGQERTALVWTKGRDYWEIGSTSKPAILLFEERINAGKSLEDGSK